MVWNATIDGVAMTVSIGTTHFTDVSLVRGYQIPPASSKLKVNESLSLQVVFCYPPLVGPTKGNATVGTESSNA